MFNAKLYKTFKTACSHRDMEIHWDVSSLNVYFDNGNYIMLWTPLNTLPRKQEIETDEDIQYCLDRINDYMEDYHIECNAKDMRRSRPFFTAAHANGKIMKLKNNPTVDGWFDLFDYAQDNDAIDMDYAFWCLTVEDEEETE